METLGCYWRDILQREDDNLQELICNNFHQGNNFCRARLPGHAIWGQASVLCAAEDVRRFQNSSISTETWRIRDWAALSDPWNERWKRGLPRRRLVMLGTRQCLLALGDSWPGCSVELRPRQSESQPLIHA